MYEKIADLLDFPVWRASLIEDTIGEEGDPLHDLQNAYRIKEWLEVRKLRRTLDKAIAT